MSEEIIKKIEELLTSQHFGVLNTLRHDAPHSTLICFAPSSDFTKLIFYSAKQTRKSINTKIYDKVSLFIDNTRNSPEDLFEATTIAAYGSIIPVDQELEDTYRGLYLKKNPHMGFFLTEGVEMMVIEVDHYDLVSQFQTILQTEPKGGTYEIRIRQIQGKSVQEGKSRGPFVSADAILSEMDLTKYIVLIDDAFDINEHQPAGIVTTSDISTDRYTNYRGPMVKIDETFETEEGTHVTLDGYLGVIIFHQVK